MSGLARLFPHPVLSISLAVVWLTVNASVAPGHIALALALAVGLPLLCRGFWPERVPIPPRGLLLLALLFLRINRDIVAASLTVVVILVSRRTAAQDARFETVPLACRSPSAQVLLIGIITLTPGTLVADLDHENGLMLVHWLHEPDPEGAIARLKCRYEEPLMEVFG